MSELSPLHKLAAATGAVFEELTGWLMPAHFNNMPDEYHHARDRAALFDRSHHGKIQVRGADAASFLHNLCTNDVKALQPGTGCEAFLTNAKAKVVAYIFIWRDHAEPALFWLDTGPGRGHLVLKHLDRHLISEQVELADKTHDYAQLHLAGPAAHAVLDRAAGSATPLMIREHTYLGVPGFDILCDRAHAEAAWQLLVHAGATPAGREAYEILRVEAGTPVFGTDLDEERFVVEVGRTRQAICYTKGCYLGQEPIVMARDRGHVNRLLLGLRINDPLGVPVGARVFRDGAEVGTVTSSVVSPRLSAIALAYLRRGNWDAGTAVLVDADSEMRSAVVVSLPFEGAAGSA